MEEIRRIPSDQIEVLSNASPSRDRSQRKDQRNDQRNDQRPNPSLHQTAQAQARQAFVSIKRVSPLTALILTPVFIGVGLIALPLIILVFAIAFFFARSVTTKFVLRRS